MMSEKTFRFTVRFNPTLDELDYNYEKDMGNWFPDKQALSEVEHVQETGIVVEYDTYKIYYPASQIASIAWEEVESDGRN